MTFIAVRCPHFRSNQIVKRGKTARGTQRYLGQNTLCAKGSFLLDARNRGCLPAVKQQIIDMSLNASGIRDTADRCISVPTLCGVHSKERSGLGVGEHRSAPHVEPRRGGLGIERAGSGGRCNVVVCWEQGQPALALACHQSQQGRSSPTSSVAVKTRAFCCSRGCLSLGLPRSSTDHWGADTRIWTPPCITQANANAKIERKHLTICTRIKRLVR